MLGRVVDTPNLFALGLALFGGWMVLLAQWALPATGREVCYVWWTTTALGAFTILVGLSLAVARLYRRR
jgi:hypothetical protein